MEQIKGKKVLITGGTGSFGNAMLKKLLATDVNEIRIFSRDEFKQDVMRSLYLDKRIKYFIGDIKDKETLKIPLKGVDYVFHAAAMKQVPSCEHNVVEATKVNVLGTTNVLDACIEASVGAVVVLSTDKAAYPINAMGITKALAEKIAIEKSLQEHNTRIMVTRYGNVLYSRGSVIPIFKKQAESGEDLTVTNGEMTRFLMTLDEAVELVLYAFLNGRGSETFIMKAKSTDLYTLANKIVDMYGSDESRIKIIGERKGEKTYEVLVTQEEMNISIDNGMYMVINWRVRDRNLKTMQPYTSSNCDRFTASELENIIKLGKYENSSSWT